MLCELVTATEEFDLIQLELVDLYKQDKYGVYECQALLVSENTTLRQAGQGSMGNLASLVMYLLGE